MKPLRTAAILLIFAIATVVFGAVLVILDLPLQFLVIMLVPVIAFSVDYPRSIYLPMILFFTGVAVWASFNLSPNLQNSLQTILATLIFAVATCEIVSWLAGRGRQVEEALRESEEKYRLIFEGSRDGIIFLDSENRREFANRRLAEIDGYTEEELAGKSVMSVVHPEDLPQIRENNRRRLAGESFSHTYEFRLIHKDGHPVDVEGTFNAIKRDDKVIGICGIIRDISDRKRAEAELELIHAYAPCILWRGDVEWRDGKAHWSIRVANPEAAQRFLPIAKDPAEDYFEALARNRAEFAKETMQLDEDAARAFAEGSSHLQHAFPCRRSDGEIRWIYEDAYIQPAGPDRWQVAGVSTDITDRRRSEDEIKQALSLLAATLESTVDGILVVDLKGKVLSFNKKFLDLWRIPATVVETNDDRIMLQFVMEQLSDPKGFMAKVQELYAHPDRESSDTINFKDGRLFERFSQPQWIEGKSVGRVWSFRDVTERKQAEEDRLMMERQMQQTQQLESLGVLAGGIAHDFNNILMAILGHADLALDDVTPTSPVHDALLEIIKASRRAAELCRQMLAYSGRGSFVIETIALSGLIDDMVHLLRTSISKSAVLKLDLDREARPIRGDATQIRQIILNLIVNASEAIGQGKRI